MAVRISKQRLRLRADLINECTDHEVQLWFTDGCGSDIKVDGKWIGEEQGKKLRNKDIFEIQEPFMMEIWRMM